MYDEIDAAIKLRDKHIRPVQQLIRKYAGKNYRDGWLTPQDTYENHAFEYITNMIPAWSYDNPACEVTTRVPGLMDEVVEAIKLALNQWVKEVQISKTLRSVAVDTCFAWGVCAVTLENVPGHQDEVPPPMWPAAHRILPTRFFIDPYATSLQDSRYMGHVWVRDKAELLAAVDEETGMPLFNAAALEEISPDEGMAALNARELRQDTLSGLYLARNMVVGYEVWDRNTNMIYTLGYGRSTSKQGQFLRAPREFVGCPKHGPYHVFGIYSVPGQPYPLSPLQVTADLVDEIDAHAGQMKSQAASAKRLIITDTNQTADKITMSPDGTVITVPGFSKAETLEFDGPAKANLEYSAMLLGRLDRQSGLSDLVRGNVTGDPTATEASLASTYANIRTRYAQSVFREAVSDVLENAAYIMYTNPRVAFFMAIETPMGPQTAAYSGGQWPGQEIARFEHLQIKIDPYSMEWVNEGLRQAQMAEVFDRVVNVGMAAPQLMLNGLNVVELLNDLGETINVKNMGEKYLNPALTQQAAMMQVNAMMAPPPGGDGSGGGSGDKQPKKGNVRSEAQVRKQAV